MAALLVVASAIPAFAFSERISVPPGTVSVTVATVGVSNATGQATSATSNSFCPAGSTITVTQPNNTSSTTYGSTASFNDANGNLIAVVTVVQGDGGSNTQENM